VIKQHPAFLGCCNASAADSGRDKLHEVHRAE